MSTYFTIAAILTVAYIIYYAVVIMNDLYGKKNTPQSSVEEFDVPKCTDNDEAEELEEQPVTVVESDDGFQVADVHYETETFNDEPEASQEETITEAAADTAEPEQKDALEDASQELQQRGDPIKPAFSTPFMMKELRQQVINQATGKHSEVIGGKPKINIESVVDIRV